MIISDFDGVLFNDHRFKGDYKWLFTRSGVPHRVHQAAYREAKKTHASGAYRHDKHLAIVRQKMPLIDPRAMEKNISQFLARSGTYLYSDALPFLSYWKKRKQKLALVSSGFAFQKKKVAASGLRHFFHPAVITGTQLKVEPIGRIIKKFPGERVVFMDDRKEVVDAIKKAFPRIFVIQVVRRSSKERSTRADAVVKNLAAARALCENTLKP